MAVDSTGKKFTMSDTNEETFGELIEQLGGILGVGTRSDGKYYLADMCQSESINKWAKYKPVRHSTYSNITEAQRKELNYGIKIPHYTWMHLLLGTNAGYAELADADRMFVYEKPRGAGNNEWARIRDFDGYKHNVKLVAAVGAALGNKLYYDVNNYIDFYIQTEYEDEACNFSDLRLQPSMASTSTLRTLEQCYVCALLTTGSSHYIINTKKTPAEVQGGAYEIHIPKNTFNNGDVVDFYFCLHYDTSIPEGLEALSSGMYTNTYFIPLNLTTEMKGERQVTMGKVPMLFDGFTLTYDTVIIPDASVARNYYQIGSGGTNGYYVYSVNMPDNSQLGPHSFRREIYIKRGTEKIVPESAGWTAVDTIESFDWSESMLLASKNLGSVTFYGATDTQSGDELWLKVTWLPTDGTSEQLCWENVIYTY